jgi:hypothetical protein
MMWGIRFVVDENGGRTAVLIDLKRHSELWEDFYDRAPAHGRSAEPRMTLAAVRSRLGGGTKLGPVSRG